MKFHDFEIQAWQHGESQAQVIVHDSPAGFMRSPVLTTVNKEQLDHWCWLFDTPNWYRKEAPGLRKWVNSLGRDLASILLPAEVNDLLTESQRRIPEGDGLRLRLCLDQYLVDLPWEFLYCDRDFLCLDENISLVREPAHLPLGADLPPAERRMVFAGMAMLWPDGTTYSEVEELHEKLVKGLAPAERFVSPNQVTAAGDQIDMELRSRALIFQYAGYTCVHAGTGCLVREIKGNPPQLPDYSRESVAASSEIDYMPSEELARLLKGARTRLALFSASNSGRWVFVEPLMKAEIPAVIGTRGRTSNEALVVFCSKLYSTLAQGRSLDEAVSSARIRVYRTTQTNLANLEWGAFMVYMPSRQAVLFPRDEGRPPAGDLDLSNINQFALQQAIAEGFGSVAGLDQVCLGVEQELRDSMIEDRVSHGALGGNNVDEFALNLVRFLVQRRHMVYLIRVLRRDYGWVMERYGELA